MPNWAALADKTVDICANAFSEPTRYTSPSAPGGIPVRGTWAPVELADLGQGFVADVSEVSIPVVDIGAHIPDASSGKNTFSLTRFPGTPSEETWDIVGTPKTDGHTWSVDVSKRIRPVPK